MVGKFQATVVSDGPLPLGEPSATMKGQTKEELAKALADNFLPTDKIVLEQNALILNTGSKLVLFDTGMGTAKPFGPTTGRLLKSLEEAKISPSAIDDVICSHGHIDHIGGLADAKGKRYFPNATVWITKADYDFWTDESQALGRLEAVRPACPAEPAALQGPHQVDRGRQGRRSRRAGHGVARPHRGAHASSSSNRETRRSPSRRTRRTTRSS